MSLSVSPEDAESTCYGKLASELQTNVKITGTKITGTLHKVTEYTEFSGDPSEQSGNYLAMKVSAPSDATVKLKLIGGAAPEKTLPPSDHLIVWRITATTQKPQLTITRNSKTGTVQYDLSGLTLES